MDDSPIARRKNEHVALALGQDVSFHTTTTLLEQVQLVHDPLPELSLEQIDTSCHLLGRALRFPLVIAAMTGGSSRTRELNVQLATIAQMRGYAFGLGSQRAMLADRTLTATYQVRHVAPDVLVLGNLGLTQARELPTAVLRQLVDDIGADALCIHMNPAQEVVQPEGDHDFRGGLDTFGRLTADLGCPVIAKETGCGVSFAAAQRLHRVGVRHVDVSGAGGTSWVAIESLRARGSQHQVGQMLREWGIPTAASIQMVRSASMETVIATGGVSTGLDIAKAIALGASAAGIARPVLQALHSDGLDGAVALLEVIEAQLRAVMLLVGAATLAQLATRPRLLGPDLVRWLSLASGTL